MIERFCQSCAKNYFNNHHFTIHLKLPITATSLQKDDKNKGFQRNIREKNVSVI